MQMTERIHPWQASSPRGCFPTLSSLNMKCDPQLWQCHSVLHNIVTRPANLFCPLSLKSRWSRISTHERTERRCLAFSSWRSDAHQAAVLSFHDVIIWISGVSGRPHRRGTQRKMHLWCKGPLRSVPRAGPLRRTAAPRYFQVTSPSTEPPRSWKAVWRRWTKRKETCRDKVQEEELDAASAWQQPIWNLVPVHLKFVDTTAASKASPGLFFFFFSCVQPAEAKTPTTWRSPWRACC